MHWYGTGMGWGPFFMTANWLLFAAVLAGGVYLIVRYAAPGRASDAGVGPVAPGPIAAQTPERLLAERFAQGQIDDEEYQRRLAVLRTSRP